MLSLQADKHLARLPNKMEDQNIHIERATEYDADRIPGYSAMWSR
jgi:hypothetical protein